MRKTLARLRRHFRDDLLAEVNSGKNHDQIVDALIVKYGDERFLAAPRDRGFNRVAWLFPYLLGVTGVVGLGIVAKRWSKRPDDAAPADDSPQDAAMNERLDDELRNLD